MTRKGSDGPAGGACAHWQTVSMGLNPGLSEHEVPPLCTSLRHLLSSFRLREALSLVTNGRGQLGAPPVGVDVHKVIVLGTWWKNVGCLSIGVFKT